MARIAGIKTEKDSRGQVRYLRIDLKQHGDNELLEDFLDGLEAKNRRGGETITLDEFKEYVEKRLSKK